MLTKHTLGMCSVSRPAEPVITVFILEHICFSVQHSPFTTVGEALWFSSRLRFEKSVDNETVREFIEEVLPLAIPDAFVLQILLVGFWSPWVAILLLLHVHGNENLDMSSTADIHCICSQTGDDQSSWSSFQAHILSAVSGLHMARRFELHMGAEFGLATQMTAH